VYGSRPLLCLGFTASLLDSKKGCSVVIINKFMFPYSNIQELSTVASKLSEKISIRFVY
jgi:hypothetical protein